MIPLMFLDLQDYNQTWLGNHHQWAGKWKPHAFNAGLSIAMLPLPNPTDRTSNRLRRILRAILGIGGISQAPGGLSNLKRWTF